MNKLDFLRRLDKELSVLDREERREILAFYEERFYNGTIYENKTEEEVIAELERPESIARNVLEEYGVSPRTVKVKEERYSNVNPVKAVFLILFDVFVVAGVLPALYAAAVAIIGSSFTWVTTIGIILGNPSAVDQYVFGFMTAAFILLFLFGLVVLEAALWMTRTIIKWHLNVFKVNNREKTIKKLSRFSLDSWFKKHRGARKLKNLMLIGSLVGILYSGYWIVNHYDWVKAEYSKNTIVDETITEDFTAELADADIWTITTELENIAVEVVRGSSSDVVVKHTYFEDDNFEYTFDFDSNNLHLENDTRTNIQLFWDPSELFNLFSGTRNLVRIELPQTLDLEDVDIQTSNGTIYIRNLALDDVNLHTSNSRVDLINVTVDRDTTIRSTNGKVDVSSSVFSGLLSIVTSNAMVEINDVEIEGNLTIQSSNGRVEVIDVLSTNDSDLSVVTSNNTVKLSTTGFENYKVVTSNGKVLLNDLNSVDKPASSVDIKSTNNDIEATNVYSDSIIFDTSNGDIELHNDDTSFRPTILTLTTSSYSDVDSNVVEK